MHLRRVVVLNRDAYSCRYCSRSAWEVFEESGHTLRFHLDHRTAKAGTIDCDDFDLDDIVTACRSCNIVKGQMDEGRFIVELRSLARAARDLAQVAGLSVRAAARQLNVSPSVLQRARYDARSAKYE